MSLLSDAQLTRMRTQVNRSLPGTAIIQRQIWTDNAGGGGTLSWTAAGTVACRIAPIRAEEEEYADRISLDAKWMVTLPALTNISETNRILTGGTTYEVESVASPRTYEVSCRVGVNEVT
jgi:head-tail adaptor